MRVTFLVLFTLFFLECSFAFNLNDSSNRKTINTYEKLYQYSKTKNKPDSVLHYANILLVQYQESSDTIKILNKYYETGEYLLNNRQYRLVAIFLNSYVQYAEEIGNNYHIAKAYSLTANYLTWTEINFEIALKYYKKALAIFDSIKDYYEQSQIHNNLGIYYSYIGQHEQTLDNYLKSAEICKEHRFNHSLYVAYREIAEEYRHAFKDYNNGINYYKKALDIAKELNDSALIADAIIEIGCVNLQYNKTDSVLSYYSRALEIGKDIQNKSILDFCYSHLSVFYEKSKDYEKALYYQLKTSKDVIWGFENWIPEPLLKIAELEQKLGYYKEAAGHFQKYIHLKDSLDKIKETKEFSKLELKFEMENIEIENRQKEEKIKAELQKQKAFRNGLILFVLLSLVILYLIYRNYINKQNTNKKIHEADKLKLRFFINISHELRTPLTLLISPLERLQLKNTDDKRILDTMLKNGNKLKAIINQTLDISKIDNDSFSLQKELCDFNNVLRSTASMFNSIAEEKNIDFQVSLEQPQMIFSFDKERITQVITNLLSNTFKYTPDGGAIIASSYKIDNHLICSVKDTGIGIPNEDSDKIFTRFYQSDKGKNGHYAGTGLGLNIVKEYVEAHEGTISVNSEAGIGSEFTIKLPLKQYSEKLVKYTEKENQVDMPAISLNNHEEIPVTENIPTILIVEDNRDLRDYLKVIFKIRYNILEAANGEEGKEIASKENPDVIISDVMMPICDGYCLTEYLKSHIETSHIPIILLTAKAAQNDKITGYEFGADDYITKPFDEKELVLKVQNILLTRKKLKEKFKKNTLINLNEIDVSSLDEQFIKKLTKIIEANISNSDFSVEQLSGEMGISRRNLYRKIKALTDMNTSEYIRYIRLNRAAYLLEQKAGSVSEIAYQAGFESLSYFTKCFKENFEKLPSEYS